MGRTIKKRIERLAGTGPAGIVSGGLKGIEKESLRVMPDGQLADTPHPVALGSALSNQFITTDFSEALLEFVTPANSSTWEALRILCDIHQFTYQRLDDELLWVTSMPCLVSGGDKVPLAQYGNSNVGRMKTVYRNGLGLRYGRRMQTIAGVHFNYSLPDGFWPVYRDHEGSDLSIDEFRSDSYMALVRNFRRFGWLVLYLFGASPALCKSFLGESTRNLQDFNENTSYEPFGTSLRMSDLGYSNNTQARLNISLNNLHDYIDDLSCAICTPEPRYRDIGVRSGDEYLQLSANQLQIENEYYSPIRPKRVAQSGERPTVALRRGGVQYVEIRSLDLNVFDPVGINQNAMRFMEAFVIYCLLEDSPPFDEAALSESARNHTEAARDGRNPAFRLHRDGKEVALRDWAADIMGEVANIAELIDQGDGGSAYADAVAVQQALITDPDATPSARVLQEMRETKTGFFHFAMNMARGHKDYFAALEPLRNERLQLYSDEAASSLQRQRDIEASDTMTFDEYLAQYFTDQGCCQ